MAQIHGMAGEWARVRGSVLGLWPLFLGVFALGFSAAVGLSTPRLGAILTVVSAIWILWSLQRGLRHVERYFKGARGEERVSEILKGLPDDYHVFNDFTGGRSHVDHVVIGPGGVFAIETKSWRGRVTIDDGRVLLDGRPPDRSPVRQAVKEALDVRETLSRLGWAGAVTPVLAFATDTFAAHRADLHGTVVINACELRESFGSGRVVIPPAELERLVSLMESNS